MSAANNPISGTKGQVKFKNTTGTVAVVAGTKSWSLSIVKDAIEITQHGENFKTNIGGEISGSGTCVLVFDKDTTSSQKTFYRDIVTTNDVGDGQFELLTDSGSATQKITFKGVVTQTDFSAETGALQEVTVNFVCTGTIDISGY